MHFSVSEKFALDANKANFFVLATGSDYSEFFRRIPFQPLVFFLIISRFYRHNLVHISLYRFHSEALLYLVQSGMVKKYCSGSF